MAMDGAMGWGTGCPIPRGASVCAVQVFSAWNTQLKLQIPRVISYKLLVISNEPIHGLEMWIHPMGESHVANSSPE